MLKGGAVLCRAPFGVLDGRPTVDGGRWTVVRRWTVDGGRLSDGGRWTVVRRWTVVFGVIIALVNGQRSMVNDQQPSAERISAWRGR
jgi:hypothetical protein